MGLPRGEYKCFSFNVTVIWIRRGKRKISFTLLLSKYKCSSEVAAANIATTLILWFYICPTNIFILQLDMIHLVLNVEFCSFPQRANAKVLLSTGFMIHER